MRVFIAISVILSFSTLSLSQNRLGISCSAGLNGTFLKSFGTDDNIGNIYRFRPNSPERAITINYAFSTKHSLSLAWEGGSQSVGAYFPTVSPNVNPSDRTVGLHSKYIYWNHFEGFVFRYQYQYPLKRQYILSFCGGIGQLYYGELHEGRVFTVGDSEYGSRRHSTSCKFDTRTNRNTLTYNVGFGVQKRIYKQLSIKSDLNFYRNQRQIVDIYCTRNYVQFDPYYSKSYFYKGGSNYSRMSLNVGLSYNIKRRTANTK